MVDVKPTNVKLQIRARRILREICGDRCAEIDEELDDILKSCDGSVKVAAARIYLGVSVEEAKLRLRDADGVLSNVFKTQTANPNEVRTRIPDLGMGFILCIDGGGSKCQAVIRSKAGTEGIGEAGPCNP